MVMIDGVARNYQAGNNNPSVTADPSASVSFEKVYPTFNAGNWNFSYDNPYQAPAPAYYPPPAQSNTPTYGIGAPSGGGYGGAPVPQPQPAPVISPKDWLNSGGDSQYQNQLGQLDSALTDFLSRIASQRDNFNSDYKTATDAQQRNQDNGMLNLGEDFTSRGLANSGLFNQQRDLAMQNYNAQRNGIDTAHNRGLADFLTQENDKRSSTQQAKDNAAQQAMARYSANQMF